MSRFATLSVAGILLVALCAFVALSGCKKISNESKQAAVEKYGASKLKIYLPGQYMANNIIPDFKKKYGVDVIVEFFDSNEMMYAKIQSGEKYDILIPSDYMIERLLKQNMLQPLDKAAIPNMSELDPAVTHLAFDPNNDYSVPYFWGSVGILYNKDKVDPEDLKAGYSIFKNTKYKGQIYWYDSERDSFMVALKVLGYSMNSSDKAELQKAYDWLLDMNKTMSPTYVTDEVIDSMANGQKDIAIVYSGDAASNIKENGSEGIQLGYLMPEEGTNVWYDAMVVPANAEAPKLAFEFINYVSSYEVSKTNTLAVGYTSPNAKVLAEVTAPGGEFATNPAYKPRTGYAKDEIFHYNETITTMTSDLWIKVKAD